MENPRTYRAPPPTYEEAISDNHPKNSSSTVSWENLLKRLDEKEIIGESFWKDVMLAAERSLTAIRVFVRSENPDESGLKLVKEDKVFVDQFLAAVAKIQESDKNALTYIRGLQSFLSSIVGEGPTLPTKEDVKRMPQEPTFPRMFYPMPCTEDPMLKPYIDDLLKTLSDEKCKGEAHMDIPFEILYSMYEHAKKKSEEDIIRARDKERRKYEHARKESEARDQKRRMDEEVYSKTDAANWYIAQWMKTYLMADPNRMENVACKNQQDCEAFGLIVLHGGYLLKIYFPRGDGLRFAITVYQ
jgi:hypothetical protein